MICVGELFLLDKMNGKSGSWTKHLQLGNNWIKDSTLGFVSMEEYVHLVWDVLPGANLLHRYRPLKDSFQVYLMVWMAGSDAHRTIPSQEGIVRDDLVLGLHFLFYSLI